MDALQERGELSSLLKAVKSAGLVDRLKENGPFTVFAPNDDAFKNIGGTFDNLMKPENVAQLKEVILRHVINQKRFLASDLHEFPRNETAMETLKEDKEEIFAINEETKFTIKSSKVNAELKKPDMLLTRNGVVHLIDKVLL